MPLTYDQLRPLTTLLLDEMELRGDPTAVQTVVGGVPGDGLPHLSQAVEHVLNREFEAGQLSLDQFTGQAPVDQDSNTRAFIALTQARIHIGNHNKTKAVSELASIESLLLDVDPQLAMAIQWMLGVHRRRIGDLAGAFSSLQLALDLARKEAVVSYIASITADVANVHLESGDPVKALAAYEDAVRLLTSINKDRAADRVLINVATAKQRLGRHQDAETIYEDLLLRSGSSLEHNIKGMVLLNLAVAKKHLQKPADAMSIYQRVLEEEEKDQFTEAMSRALIGLAGILSEHGQFGESLGLLARARAGNEQKGQRSDLLAIDGLLADVLWDSGDHDGSLLLLTNAYEESKTLSFTRLTLDLGHSLEWRLMDRGMAEDAYSVLKHCSSLREGVYAKESERALELGTVRATMHAERESLKQREEDRRRLMHDVLPGHIADRLLSGQNRIAERLDHVGILFADIVGFTRIAAQQQPDDVLLGLESLFQGIDEIMRTHHCEKIKTIGDAYMATNTTRSLPDPDGIVRLVRCAKDMQQFSQSSANDQFALRIGLHHGPVVAGVMSGMRLAYDMWGDTVNIASRMESTSEPGKIQVSASVAAVLGDYAEFTLVERSLVEVRGVGHMKTFWVE